MLEEKIEVKRYDTESQEEERNIVEKTQGQRRRTSDSQWLCGRETLLYLETSEQGRNKWTSKTVMWKQWTPHWEEKRGEGFLSEFPGTVKNEREMRSLSGEWG